MELCELFKAFELFDLFELLLLHHISVIKCFIRLSGVALDFRSGL